MSRSKIISDKEAAKILMRDYERVVAERDDAQNALQASRYLTGELNAEIKRLRAVAEQAREALLRAHDDWTDHSWSLSADCRYRVEQALAALDSVLKEK